MRRTVATPGTLAYAACVLASLACSRTWELPGVPGGASGSQPAGSSGNNGGSAGEVSGTGGFGPGGFGGNAGGGGHGSGAVCIGTQQNGWINHPAQVMLVAGRNASMATKLDGDSTRILAVQSAIRSVVQGNQDAIQFGYQEFPGMGNCGNTCCPSMSLVVPQNRAFNNIDDKLKRCDGSPGPACVSTSESRPLGGTLDSVRKILPGTNSGIDAYVVLIVDGPPSCSYEDPGTSCLEASGAVVALNNSSIKTYVLAVGDDAKNDNCLRDLANSGGTNSSLMMAPDADTLRLQLLTIAAMAAPTSCTIELTFRPTDPDLVIIIVMGQEVPHETGPRDGWDYTTNSTTQIQVRGEYCNKLRGNSNSIRVLTGCPPCGDGVVCNR